MSLHVLIADHRMDQLMLLAEFLLRRGLHAATCMDGDQALEAIRSHCADDQPYDLVIAHVDLPKVAGLRVLYEARRLHLATVVAVSCPRGRRDEQVETMIRKTGVSAVLDQPFDLAQIDALVKQALKLKPASAEPVAEGPARAVAPEIRPESAELPAIAGEPPPVAQVVSDDDVDLPTVGSPPAEGTYRRRLSDFYDPQTGTLGRSVGPPPTSPEEPMPAAPAQRSRPAEPPLAKPLHRQRADPFAPTDDPQPQAEQGYTRRRSSEFFAAGSPAAGTTRRIRRGLTGSYSPDAVAQRQATCGHCGQLMTFRPTLGMRSLPCSACGQLIRLEE